ncbi:MAG: (2Fe-2S)-binding protein [Oligoflexia bacterium]|nr:(2Fe-2S)-binding protein [Oligoflexia bacterium]
MDLSNTDTTKTKAPQQITIDGQSLSFTPGETIMQVAERAGISKHIAHFCYHPSLSIAGTCRMCAVEVEKVAKLMTSCSTPATNGMVVYTNSEKVKASRNGVMEFLLANHPLDCPVCDQAGECSLQEYNYEYGPSTSRFGDSEEKRVFENATTLKLSPLITLNMNRCIHCERCVRFCAEITETHELLMVNRGHHKELTLADPSKGLTSDYQGCLADVCPVGALTFNDFRFKKRVWFLKQHPSICDGCSRGCNIEVHSEDDIVYRYTPRFNQEINKHWMCDEGRLSYHRGHDKNRIVAPYFEGHECEWHTLLADFTKSLKSSKSALVVFTTDATSEEVATLTSLLPQLHKGGPINFRYISSTPDENPNENQDENQDQLLRRKDKTPNRQGVASKLSPISEADFQSFNDLVIIFKGSTSKLPRLAFSSSKHLYLWGVFLLEDLENIRASNPNIRGVLPGVHTLEKSGSYTNCDGITQTFTAAIRPPKLCVPVERILSKILTTVTAEGEAK